MNPLFVHAIAAIGVFAVWRIYQFWLLDREQRLRQRVAYMLWVAAQYAD